VSRTFLVNLATWTLKVSGDLGLLPLEPDRPLDLSLSLELERFLAGEPLLGDLEDLRGDLE